MQVEGLACCVVGVRQFFATVSFTDEHAGSSTGMPVALIRGCTVARDQVDPARLVIRPAGLCPEPPDVRLCVEPDTTDAEICLLWLAGFRVGPGQGVRHVLGARRVAPRRTPAPPGRDPRGRAGTFARKR
jgi:hypothetical protein